MSTELKFLNNYNELIEVLSNTNAIFIIDANVYNIWKDIIPSGTKYIILETSEELKNLKSIYKLYVNLLEMNANRNTRIIGIGGGITTDMVGYLASTYMRGMKFDFIPTTLLAMVDAAIGGKNGVNFNGYKNIIGTINQPDTIYFYTDFLRTLPTEEIYSAFGEILKYGIGFKCDVFDLLKNQSIKEIINNTELLSKLIQSCAITKYGIVVNDEKEIEHNGRRLLNLGHTMGHALEKYQADTNAVPIFKHHGYAVIYGLYYITKYIKNKEYKNEVKTLLEKYINEIGLNIPNIEEIYKDCLQYIKKDKKSITDETVYLIIPIEKGKCKENIKKFNELL